MSGGGATTQEITDEFRIVQGEDWTCYVEWLDQDGNPISSADGTIAMMQVREYYGGPLIIEFVSAADPADFPSCHVLGQSGVTRLTCPRQFSSALIPGRYFCDLFIMHIDEDNLIFNAAQHHRMLKAWFLVEHRVTEASYPGDPGAPPPLGIYKGTIGDGVNTSFSLVHNLGNNDVAVLVYNVLDGTGADVEHQRVSVNEVTVTFNSPPPPNSFRVIITEV